MEVCILGPLVVRRDGCEVTIGPAKQRALLTLLALGRDAVIPTETLVDDLWGGSPPATAVKIVHGYVSQLRRTLGDGVLETAPGGYRLRLGRQELDVSCFEGLLDRGLASLDQGDPSSGASLLGQALALWRGPPLVDFRFQDFAANEIRRLDELRLIALEHRLGADLALGRHVQAIPELQALVSEYPLRELLRRQLMLALYRAGRQAEALAAYRDARLTFVEQIGLDPSDDLQHLEAAILIHDPALDLPDGASVVTSTSARPHTASVSSTPDPRYGTLPSSGTRRARARPQRQARRKAPLLAVAGGVALVFVCVVALVPGDVARPHLMTLPPDSVGFIDMHGDRVSNEIRVAGEPTSIAAGEGAVWAVDATAGAVARIDPASHSVVQTIPVGPDAGEVAVGGGSVWVTDHGENTVSRISPLSNAVVQTVPVGAGPIAIAYGYDSVWVTNGDDRTLTRIDAASGKVKATVRTNAVGRGVAIGGGSVWITDEATGSIVGVNPTTDVVSSSITVGSGPTGVTYGDGAVWVVNALDGTVSRVDTGTLSVQSTIPVPGGPSAVSFASGAIWVSAEFASSVVRIDPARAMITASTAIGTRPEALASTPSGVWVAAQASGAGHRGGRLVVTGQGVDSIDPSVGSIFPDLSGPAYDALTGLRHVGGSAGTQIVPDLAISLPQPTARGLTYIFQLRPQLRYSDGGPVQAADFARGLERLLRLNPLEAPMFSHIIGAAACSSGGHCDLSRGVIGDGSSTVTFHLGAPDARLVEDLQYLVPVPAGTPERDVGTTPVPGTGPYTIQSYVPGRLITYVRNRYFHVWSEAARPDGFPDEIVYRFDADEDDALRQVIAGRSDLVQLGNESSALAQFAAQRPVQVHVLDEQAIVFVFLNTRRAPFDDPRVRRALNFAVDREHVVDLYGAALARPTCQLVPPTATGYRPYCPYTIDPTPSGRWSAPDLSTARSLVDASGTKGQRVTLWTGPEFLSEASYVVGVLNELGYRAVVHEVTQAPGYFDALDKAPDTQAGMFGWFGTPLAVDMLSTITCGFTPNPSHFCDPQIDDEINRLADAEPTDPAAAADLASGVDRQVTDEAPWVPLFTPRTVDVTSARVGNYQAQFGQALLDQLWVR